MSKVDMFLALEGWGKQFENHQQRKAAQAGLVDRQWRLSRAARPAAYP